MGAASRSAQTIDPPAQRLVQVRAGQLGWAGSPLSPQVLQALPAAADAQSGLAASVGVAIAPKATAKISNRAKKRRSIGIGCGLERILTPAGIKDA